MDLQTVLFFGMGMMVEVFNILRSNEGLPTRKNILKYLFVFAFPLSALLPGKKEKEYDLIVHVFSYFILLGTTTAVLFRDEILPIIRERTMLMFTLIFWYLQVSIFGLSALLHPFFAIPLGFTALVLVNAFSRWHPPSFVKVMITVWFFIMAFVIGWMTLGTPIMNMFDGQGVPPSGM